MTADQSETTLRRGMSILFALGTDEALEGRGLGVVHIAELVGREKSQVSRTLRTLEECGVVARDPETLQYRLSWELFALAARAGDHQLVEAAPPILERLVSRLEETVYLNVLQGNEVLTIAMQQGARIVSASGTVGGSSPGYCTSAGRALLLDHTP
jgi:DNA-binding IclR family transcriptional regulator